MIYFTIKVKNVFFSFQFSVSASSKCWLKLLLATFLVSTELHQLLGRRTTFVPIQKGSQKVGLGT